MDKGHRRIEDLLKAAATQPACRPEFYHELLNSTVYVIGFSDVPGEGQRTIGAGEKLSIQNWKKADGSLFIPFFTSLEVLRKSIDQDQDYFALPARDFFEITRGATLVLNPKSDYGKEFFPGEIESLLETGLNISVSRRKVEESRSVLLGQPREYPASMVDALTTLLAKHGNVRAAYLALMHDPAVDEKPHLIIGLETDGDYESVFREVGLVASDTNPDGEPVDLVRVTRDAKGIDRYFINETKPFYERGWGSKLKTFLGYGRKPSKLKT